MVSRYAYIFILAMLVAAVPSAMAQSAVSNVISFELEDVIDVYMPPELYVDISFVDDNGNMILEALESGKICARLTNKGGAAKDVCLSVVPERMLPGLVLNKDNFTTDIGSHDEVMVEIPVSADINIPTDSLKLKIKVSESMGYDINAALTLMTFEHQKPRMKMLGAEIIDAGKGLRALDDIPDGIVQKGEVVKAIVTIQNIGEGVAEDVIYSIRTLDNNVFLMTEKGGVQKIEGKIGKLKVGEVQEISFRLSANHNYNGKGRFLPVFIDVKEPTGYGDIVTENIPIPLGKAPERLQVVKVNPDINKLLAMKQSQIYSSSDRVTSNAKIRDISLAPAGEPIFADAVAIVLGAEENGYGVAPAPYAARDARVMAEYFKKSLGVKNIQVLTNKEVTSITLSDMFDANFGYLSKVVKPGRTDVFVYYSGHGMPDGEDESNQDIYLFPYDARKEMVGARGYSLGELYASLDNLHAKSVTVILDACFSGTSRQSQTYKSESISNAKGMRIKNVNLPHQPWLTNPEFRVFTSSGCDQTSLGFDQSQSGLFTYYLAVGLQGDADLDGNGAISMTELVKFVSDNVSKTAKLIRNGAQTPQFFGNGNLIIEKLR